MARYLSVLLVSSFLATVVADRSALAQSDYVARNYYGAKFEPVTGILHGAGQTYFRDRQSSICQSGDCLSEAAERYTVVLSTTRAPLLFMDYNNSTTENTPSWYAGLNDRIEVFETNYDRQLVPQLGTFLQPGTTLLTTTQINNVVSGLASLNRPVFYRPGYEANGPWFGLDAATFKTNFQNLSNAIRAANLPVAMVWNVVVGDGGGHSTFANAMNYYPGDQYVDWWSFNTFGSVTFTAIQEIQVDQFLDAADAAGFPVLIGEATPQFIGAEDASDWNQWFDPFFDRIKDNPGIKAHTYINWDWGQTNPAEGWTNWKDASLENADPTVRANYISELSDPIYIHSGPTLPSLFFDLGDANGDGVLDNNDIAAFSQALFDPTAYAVAYPGVDPNVSLDMNSDGVFDNLDISAFAKALGL